jgi:hypothetical protein
MSLRNCFKIGDKIGYLNLKNGRYMFSTIIGMEGEGLFQMEQKNKKGLVFTYNEKVENICKYMKTNSIDFADGRMLMKHKSVSN